MRNRIAFIGIVSIIAMGLGTVLAAPAAAVVPTVPGDPLTGSGAVSRTLLTPTQLTSGTSTATISNDAFALPTAAKAPANTFEGTLSLSGVATAGGFSSLKDPDGYSTVEAVKHLPPVTITLVQNGSYLIPTARGVQYTGSAYWNLAVSPGRAWNENADGTKTRASLPFALIERNANCVHNGVLTFLFDSTTVSKVRYQVTSETCEYFQFDMWGQVSASYQPASVTNSETIRTGFATEVGDRLPTKPISALATDYPSSGINTSIFGSAITPSALSTFGLEYGGVNYVGGCQTRQGAYPFCGQMLLPSYSTAKSAFSGMALMRLGQKYGTGVYSTPISSYVSEAAAKSAWNGVTLQNTLNMATGNYSSAGFEVDEGGSTMSTFFAAEAYAPKMAAALSFPRSSTPGTQWAYHSSDTFVAARAMNNYLQAQAGAGQDIFGMVRDEVYKAIKLSPDAESTVRTDNSPTGVPFGGYGLFWTQDDIAKVSKFLDVDNGKANGTQLLSSSMLDDTMQRNPANRGISTTGTPVYLYNNAFWAKQFTSADNPAFTSPFYVPFMSGFGGISVALMPNGASYYEFSDNDEFGWTPAVAEANKLAPMSSGGGSSCTPANVVGNGGFETGTATPWTATAAVVDNGTLQPAHTGSWKAWLDGFGYAKTDTLSQTVTIPAGCTSANFNFFLRITTAETQPIAYDNFTLVVTPSGGTSTQIGTWSNRDAANYLQRSFDLSAYAGQTVTLSFTGTEDSSLQTSFVIDDVRLDVG